MIETARNLSSEDARKELGMNAVVQKDHDLRWLLCTHRTKQLPQGKRWLPCMYNYV
jgi:hypothetical protein